MSVLDFAKWAIIGPNNDIGLGRMAQDMKSVLPVGRHLVTESSKMPERKLNASRDIRFSSNCPKSELEELLTGLQGLIFFERHTWHPLLLETVKRMQIRTVCVPMWEWFRGCSPSWRNVDFFACPNEFCLRILKSYGFQNAARVTWTLDLQRFPSRLVRGPGRHFVHNAGLIDPDDRKGTHDVIRAFGGVKDDRLRLTVRTQVEEVRGGQDPRVEIVVGNVASPSELYSRGDVFVQPSKLEGVGFMVLEAVASGLPVITLDVPPMNGWSRTTELLVQPRQFKYPAYSSAWVEHSHLRLPKIADLAWKIVWASQNDLTSISTENRNWAEKVFAADRLRWEWENLLNQVLRLPFRKDIVRGKEPTLPCLKLPWRIKQRIEKVLPVKIPFIRFPYPS